MQGLALPALAKDAWQMPAFFRMVQLGCSGIRCSLCGWTPMRRLCQLARSCSAAQMPLTSMATSPMYPSSARSGSLANTAQTLTPEGNQDCAHAYCYAALSLRLRPSS